jgi:hypothetical protein
MRVASLAAELRVVLDELGAHAADAARESELAERRMKA